MPQIVLTPSRLNNGQQRRNELQQQVVSGTEDMSRDTSRYAFRPLARQSDDKNCSVFVVKDDSSIIPENNRKNSVTRKRSRSSDTDEVMEHTKVLNGHSPRSKKTSQSEDPTKDLRTSNKEIEDVRVNVQTDEKHTECWYTFCFKCRKKEPHPSWQPSLWPVFCPYPFCPTYRQFARLISLGLIGVTIWCILYSIVGDPLAPPNGKVFQLAILCMLSYIGGWMVALVNMPGLIGMLSMGIFIQNIGLLNIDDSFSTITKELRSIALVIILIRAGLDLDPVAFRKLKFTILKLGLIPWAVEVAVNAVTCRFFLGLPWDYSILLNTVVAAVSPAVVVPSMFRLRTKGYGVTKGIPTLIIAIAGIDDAASVAFFGITKSIMFASGTWTTILLQGPVSIIAGLGFGILWGVICNYTPEKHDPFMVPIRILLLLTGGTVSIFGTELIGFSGAGPLACVGAAFVCLVCWSRQGWDVEQNPANTAFEIFWMVCEPILFGITGAQIKLNELDYNFVIVAVGVLVFGFVIRISATILVGVGCKLNLKEKAFVAVSVMSKASVQAALGPIALGMATDDTTREYGEKILMVCILSIILTAPTGALFITFVGPKLLKRTTPLMKKDETVHKCFHRPSLRDMTIIGEEVEAEETPKSELSISRNNVSDVSINSHV